LAKKELVVEQLELRHQQHQQQQQVARRCEPATTTHRNPPFQIIVFKQGIYSRLKDLRNMFNQDWNSAIRLEWK
jgi:hypothetical protein